MSNRDRDRTISSNNAAGRGVTRQTRGSTPSGLVSLGPKRGRSVGAPVAPAVKLAIPKPVNLPSLRKENAGNDPSTQIVPTGSGGGWTKPESPGPASVPDTGEAPVAAAAKWGSAAARSAAAPWQPPDASVSPPPNVAASVGYRGSGPVVDRRRLSPAEYPSLDAKVSAKAAITAQLARSSALISGPSSKLVGDRDWDDDDRVANPGISSILLHSRLATDDRGIDPDLLPGWEPEAQPASSGQAVPVLGLSLPGDESLQPSLPVDLPPVVLSTTHRTAPEAAPAPDITDHRQPVRPQLLRESSSGRWRDDSEWRQPPDGTQGRLDRNGFDSGMDWDRRSERLLSRESSGRYGPRSALAGPPFSERRSELADPTLFPPLLPGRSPRHASQHPADELLPDRASNEADRPVDDRDEFEMELNAVVAELQREKSRKLEQAVAPPPELEPAHEPSLAPAALAGPPASAPTAGHVDSGAVPADAVIADGAGEEATRRLAKLPPPPRAELLKQQQDEEERRRAAAAAKLADIERRIALRKEAEARAAADLAAATAAAEELAAPAASEGGDIYGAEGQQPDSSAGGTAVAEHSVAQLAAPTPEPAAPPNAWVKPLTLANGVLEPEHPLSALGAVEVSAAQVMQGSEELPEVETGTFVNHPPAADSTTQSEPQRGSGSAAAGPSAHAGEHAEVVRNQRSQRGRGRAKAERLYEPEPPDRQGPRSGRGSRLGRRSKDNAAQLLEDGSGVAAEVVEGTEGRNRRSRQHRDAAAGSGRPSGGRGRGAQGPAVGRVAQAVSEHPAVSTEDALAVTAVAMMTVPPMTTSEHVTQSDWDPVVISSGPVAASSGPAAEVPSAVLSQLRLSPEAALPVLLPALAETIDAVARGVAAVPELEQVSSVSSWPRAAAPQDDHLQAGVLANGIPALPADLSLDTPALGSKAPASQPHRQPLPHNSAVPPPPGLAFGMPHQRGQGQVTGFPAPSFGGLIWSQAPGTGGNLWQPPPPPPSQPHNAQPPAYVQQLAAAAPQHNMPTHSQLEAFYGAGQQPVRGFGVSAGASAFAAGSQQAAPAALGPQFGTFGAAFQQPQPSGQFSHFSAFVPTGKQPDWSVPPNPAQTQSSGMGGHSAGHGFPISSRTRTGLDSIWQSPEPSGRFSPAMVSPGLNGSAIAGPSSRPPLQANNIGFLPSIGIGPGAAHSGTNSGSIGEPQGVMPSGLPDSLLSDDPTSAAMRQRVPNGNVRRDGVIRGQRGRGGLQPQGVPHRGRGVPRGAVRAGGRMPVTAGRAEGRDAVVPSISGNSNSVENLSMGSAGSRSRSGRGSGRGGRAAAGPFTKPQPAVLATASATSTA